MRRAWSSAVALRLNGSGPATLSCEDLGVPSEERCAFLYHQELDKAVFILGPLFVRKSLFAPLAEPFLTLWFLFCFCFCSASAKWILKWLRKAVYPSLATSLHLFASTLPPNFDTLLCAEAGVTAQVWDQQRESPRPSNPQ